MTRVRRNRSQRVEYKPPIPARGVRYGQPRMGNHLLAVEDQVQIERTWSPSEAGCPACLAFQLLKEAQQRKRIERRFEVDGSISERAAGTGPHGPSFKDRADAMKADAGRSSEARNGVLERFLNVADVSPQRDVTTGHFLLHDAGPVLLKGRGHLRHQAEHQPNNPSRTAAVNSRVR
jgi:hypothetical protein